MIGELPSNLQPSRSKAPRVIDPPNLLEYLQVLKELGMESCVLISLEFTPSINARQRFGRKQVWSQCLVRERARKELLFGGRKKKTVGEPRGINTPRSGTVTARFKSRNLREKPRNLRTLKRMLTVACTVGTSGKDLGTSGNRNN